MFTLTNPLKSKLRLYIEYAMILAIVVLLGLAAWGKIRTARLETQVASLSGALGSANDRIVQVEAVNKAQSEAIATVGRMRELDSAVLTGLSGALTSINTQDRAVRSRLAALEKSNEVVRAYLNGAVPDPVGCLLDQSCPPSGAGEGRGAGPARAAARGVPLAQPRPVKDKR